MRKTIYILAIGWAVMVLNIIPLVPHHHHHGMICEMEEVCSCDGHENDEHTHHHDDGTSCVEHEQYIDSKSEVSELQQIETWLQPIDVTEILTIPDLFPDHVRPVGNLSEIPFTPPSFERIKPLRAPPSSLYL